MLCFSCVCCITQNLSLCKSLKSPKQAKRASSLEDFFFLFFLPETVLEDVLSSRRAVSATATVSDKLPHLCPPEPLFLSFCNIALQVYEELSPSSTHGV